MSYKKKPFLQPLKPWKWCWKGNDTHKVANSIITRATTMEPKAEDFVNPSNTDYKKGIWIWEEGILKSITLMGVRNSRAKNIAYTYAVTQQSTEETQRCLISLNGQEAEFSTWEGCCQGKSKEKHFWERSQKIVRRYK